MMLQKERTSCTDIKRAKTISIINNLALYSAIMQLIVLTVLYSLIGGEVVLTHISYTKLIWFLYPLLLCLVTLAIGTIVEKKLFGIQIVKFSNIDQVLMYLEKEVKSADHVIRDLTWLDSNKRMTAKVPNTTQRKELEKKLYDAIFERSISSKVCYRQIFTFKKKRDSRFITMKTLINRYMQYSESYKKSNLQTSNREDPGGYYCSYYETGNLGKTIDGTDRTFPKMQFMMIDDKQVVFTSRKYDGCLCAIREPTIVKLFVKYFEEAEDSDIVIYSEGMTRRQVNENIAKIKKTLN